MSAMVEHLWQDAPQAAWFFMNLFLQSSWYYGYRQKCQWKQKFMIKRYLSIGFIFLVLKTSTCTGNIILQRKNGKKENKSYLNKNWA